MPNKPTLFEKLRGKRTSDIELESESGEIDPRLPRVEEGIKKAAAGFRELNKRGMLPNLGPSDNVKKKNGIR